MAEQAAKTIVHVFVNGEKVEFGSSRVSVGDLIRAGGGTPGEYELQQREGNRGKVIKTFTDPNEFLTLKNGEHFTTRFTGPVPTS